MFRKSFFERKFYLGILVIISLTICSCSSPNESSENSITGSAPSDHSVSKNGVMHKTGLSNPMVNCISCHGSDLKGGSSGRSCYSCHGKVW